MDAITSQKTVAILDNASKLTWALSNGIIPLVAGTALATGFGGKILGIADQQCGWLRTIAKSGLCLHHMGQMRTHAQEKEYFAAFAKGTLALFELCFVMGHLSMGLNALKPMDWANTLSERSLQTAIGITPVIYLTLAVDIGTRSAFNEYGGRKSVQAKGNFNTLKHDAIFLASDMMGTALLYWGFTQPFHDSLPWAFVAVGAATDLHFWATKKN
jgi:hypothetical protein